MGRTFMHGWVAAAVASGVADVGLGIMAAARALNLDFIPLASEQYELVIPQEFYEGKLLQPLLDTLHDDRFKSAVNDLPGYDTSPMGQVRLLSPASQA